MKRYAIVIEAPDPADKLPADVVEVAELMMLEVFRTTIESVTRAKVLGLAYVENLPLAHTVN